MGLDTINLVTEDFQIDLVKNYISECPLTLIANKVPPLHSKNIADFQNYLLTDINGTEIRGLRLQNTEPFKNTGIIQISSFDQNNQKNQNEYIPYLKIQLSIPKYMNGQNFYLSNKSEIKKCFSQLENDLKEIGIFTSINGCSISRLDITNNIVTDFPYYQYLPILKNSQSEKYSCRDYGNTTFLVGNKSKQVCCYDKIDCMKSLKENIPVDLKDKNIFRVENRLLKSVTVKKYGILTAKDIVSNYEETKDIFKNNVKKILFNNSTEIQEKNVMDYDSNFMDYLSSKESFDLFVINCLLSENRGVIEALRGSIEHFLDLECQFNESKGMNKDSIKATRYRHKKDWINKLNQMLGKINNFNVVSLSQLYNELYSKLLSE